MSTKILDGDTMPLPPVPAMVNRRLCFEKREPLGMAAPDAKWPLTSSTACPATPHKVSDRCGGESCGHASTSSLILPVENLTFNSKRNDPATDCVEFNLPQRTRRTFRISKYRKRCRIVCFASLRSKALCRELMDHLEAHSQRVERAVCKQRAMHDECLEFLEGVGLQQKRGEIPPTVCRVSTNTDVRTVHKPEKGSKFDLSDSEKQVLDVQQAKVVKRHLLSGYLGTFSDRTSDAAGLEPKICGFTVSVESVMLSLIVLNILFLGLQANEEIMKHAKPQSFDSGRQYVFNYIETAFCAAFVFEILFVMLANREEVRARFKWFIFDFLLMGLAVAEEVVKFSNLKTPNMNVIRIVRFLRLSRTLRFIRLLRAFRELRVVIMSIISCLKSLVWTLVLLAAVVYIISVLLLMAIASSEKRVFEDTDLGKLRRLYYQDLLRAMVTLFQTITGGIGWDDASKPVEELIPGAWVLFVVYISFFMFAIMGVATGVFVDQAMKAIAQDQSLVALDQRGRRDATLKEIRDLFRQVVGNDKLVSAGTLQGIMNQPEVRSCFKQLDMETWDLQTFIELVDTNDELIDIDCFINGCFRLKGMAKNIDVVALRYECKVLARRQEEAWMESCRFLGRIEEKFNGRRSTRRHRASGT
eukprot:TRINITY_DN8660_c0_g1_i5.p1 TRINITY_DN8660_c0_g1~~TRINITY_DN8660_c0_g1_i5.p1  ORF type:complete len:643 (-),score=76.36 TRINITY_DN8660_c0_g1_i5:82-2010(-)